MTPEQAKMLHDNGVQGMRRRVPQSKFCHFEGWLITRTVSMSNLPPVVDTQAMAPELTDASDEGGKLRKVIVPMVAVVHP